MEAGPLTCLGSDDVAPVALGKCRHDGPGDPHRPGARQRLGVGAAREDDDRARVGDLERDPPVTVAGQDREAPVARIAEQLGARDAAPIEVWSSISTPGRIATTRPAPEP